MALLPIQQHIYLEENSLFFSFLVTKPRKGLFYGQVTGKLDFINVFGS